MEVAEIMLGNRAATKLNKISISDSTVERHIKDMSSDIFAQIVHGIKNSAFLIALQFDESTDVACISQLLVFVRYVQKEKTKIELKEEFFIQ